MVFLSLKQFLAILHNQPLKQHDLIQFLSRKMDRKFPFCKIANFKHLKLLRMVLFQPRPFEFQFRQLKWLSNHQFLLQYLLFLLCKDIKLHCNIQLGVHTRFHYIHQLSKGNSFHHLRNKGSQFLLVILLLL